MCPLGRFSLVLRATFERVADPDPPDEEDLLVQLDVALSLGRQPSLRSVDPARLQRATQGAGQSTGGCRDQIVERGRVLGVLARVSPIVLTDRAMGAKQDGLPLDRQVGLANRTSLPNDPHL
jgi:hypothetical protein